MEVGNKGQNYNEVLRCQICKVIIQVFGERLVYMIIELIWDVIVFF